MRRGLVAKPLVGLDRPCRVPLGLQRASLAVPRLRGEHGVVVTRGLGRVGEESGRDDRVPVAQFELRLTQGQPGVDALVRLDPVEQELHATPEPLGEQACDDRCGGPFSGLDERNITVRQVWPGQLRLGHVPVQPQSTDAVTDGCLTGHHQSRSVGGTMRSTSHSLRTVYCQLQ